MLKKTIRRIACILMCIVIVTLCNRKPVDTMAVNQTDVDDANKQVEETKKKIDKLNNDLTQVNNDIAAVQKVVAELDNMIIDITNNISYYGTLISNKQAEIDTKNNEISDKQAEIDAAELELKDAVESKEKQYESMKKRIQYMYECGEETFLDTIFESDDLSQVLGNAEYVSSIIAYDRKQLDKMEETQKKIENLLLKLEDDKEELEGQKQELEEQKKELVNLEQGLKDQKLLADQTLSVKESALNQLIHDQNYIEEQKKIEEAKLEEQKREAAELQRRWAEEVAKAQQQGIDADEANKRKLEEIGLAGGFAWPLDPQHNIYTSHFGPRIHPIFGGYSNHSGVDISGYGIFGSNIYACYPGTVISVDVYTPGVDTAYTKPYGTSVKIDHGAGVVTLYAHMSATNAYVGQTVKAGDKIGEVGSTGASTGAHLHLTLYIKGVLADPEPFLTKP